MKRAPVAAAVTLLIWCAASGCTTLQTIPRSEYATSSQRKAVRVLTRDSLSYEFDFAVVARDSLTGYRRQEVGGLVPEYDSLVVALEDIEQLSARRVDWYRTGLIGGVGVLTVAGAGLAKSGAFDGRGPSGGSSGSGGRVP